MQLFFFFFSSRRRHTRWTGDWSSDVCSSDLPPQSRGRERATVEPRRCRALDGLSDGVARPARRDDGPASAPGARRGRSEERRVGEEGRFLGGQDDVKKKYRREMV